MQAGNRHPVAPVIGLVLGAPLLHLLDVIGGKRVRLFRGGRSCGTRRRKRAGEGARRRGSAWKMVIEQPRRWSSRVQCPESSSRSECSRHSPGTWHGSGSWTLHARYFGNANATIFDPTGDCSNPSPPAAITTILTAIATEVGHGCGVTAGGQRGFPQHLSVVGVEGPEAGVDGAGDEDDAAGRADRAADVRRAGRREAAAFRSSKTPSGTRHATSAVSTSTATSSPNGGAEHGTLVCGFQKRPYGRTPGGRAAIWQPPFDRRLAPLHARHLGEVHDVGEEPPTDRIVGEPAPVAAADGARKHHHGLAQAGLARRSAPRPCCSSPRDRGSTRRARASGCTSRAPGRTTFAPAARDEAETAASATRPPRAPRSTAPGAPRDRRSARR